MKIKTVYDKRFLMAPIIEIDAETIRKLRDGAIPEGTNLLTCPSANINANIKIHWVEVNRRMKIKSFFGRVFSVRKKGARRSPK